MRRAHLADNQYGYSQVPQSNQHIEEENDAMTNNLKDKVKALKSLSIDIGTEVREQNKFLGDMDDDFDKTGGFLGKTMSRVQAMAKAGHNRYICYLLLFACFVFFIIWLIIKFR